MKDSRYFHSAALYGLLRRRPILAALASGLVASAVLMPVTANPFDLALINGTANSWLSWHLDLFLYWKFGADYAFANVASACAARVLSAVGLSVPTAVHISFKLMLVAAYLLSALALWSISRQLRPRLSVPLVTIWLLSPAVIWVAAGHAQIEPVATAMALSSLWLVLRKHWLLAGIVCGLGAGFEYVPVVALVTVAIIVIAGRAPVKAGLRFALGLILTLMACFGPLLATSVARASLIQGVVGHATAHGGAIDLKPGSVWYLAGPPVGATFMESHWLWILAFVAVAAAAAAVFATRRGSLAAPFAASGVILVAATILNPSTLPQYSVLALCGLCLIALETDLSPTLIFGPPILTIVGFTFSGPVYVYFEDSDPKVFSQVAHLLPQIPTVPAAYVFLATTAMALELLVVVVWMGRSLRARHNVASTRSLNPLAHRRSLLIPAAVQVVALAVAVAWTSQPQLWSHLLGSYPAQLFDTPYLTSQRSATSIEVRGTEIRATFQTLLAQAAAHAQPSPTLVVDYSAQDLWKQEAVGGVPHSGRNVTIPVTLPSSRSALRVTSIDFMVLAHSPQWTTRGSVDGRARIDGRVVLPLQVQIVTTDWALLTYAVNTPLAAIATSHRASIRMKALATSATLNANHAGSPWLVAWYGSGTVLVNRAGAHTWAPFDTSPVVNGADSGGQGRITLPRSIVASNTVGVPALPVIASDVSSEALTWPHGATQFAKPANLEQLATGLAYLGAVVLALIWLVVSLTHAAKAEELWSVRLRPPRRLRSSGG